MSKKKLSKEEIFERNLMQRYKINSSIYYKIFTTQKCKCAICGKAATLEKRRFAVDHNHETGFVRGLLCNYCNSRLMKYLRDDKNRAQGLVNYLQRALMQDKKWI